MSKLKLRVDNSFFATRDLLQPAHKSDDNDNKNSFKKIVDKKKKIVDKN